jgi:hypothetical protein
MHLGGHLNPIENKLVFVVDTSQKTNMQQLNNNIAIMIIMHWP